MVILAMKKKSPKIVKAKHQKEKKGRELKKRTTYFFIFQKK